jgi:hypothetical protein
MLWTKHVVRTSAKRHLIVQTEEELSLYSPSRSLFSPGVIFSLLSGISLSRDHMAYLRSDEPPSAETKV